MFCKTQHERQGISHTHLQWAQIMVEGRHILDTVLDLNDFFLTQKLSKIRDAFIILVITFKGL